MAGEKKKRALIVEGGGMRGAHTAGALAELSAWGAPHFDVICSSSAGSCTVAFWVSQQPHLFEKIWSSYLHDSQFIRYRHLMTTKAVMDLDYLFHEVFSKREPLRTDKILESEQDFYITVTHCETGEPHYLHNKNNIDVLQALRAGAAMPFAHPLPVWYENEPYADGGISDSVPIRKAIEEGCDEFWVLLTRPRNYRKPTPASIPWPRWLYRNYPGLANALQTRHLQYNDTLEEIDSLEAAGKAVVIAPDHSLPVSRFTRNRKRIVEAMRMGRHDVRQKIRDLDV